METGDRGGQPVQEPVEATKLLAGTEGATQSSYASTGSDEPDAATLKHIMVRCTRYVLLNVVFLFSQMCSTCEVQFLKADLSSLQYLKFGDREVNTSCLELLIIIHEAHSRKMELVEGRELQGANDTDSADTRMASQQVAI